MGGSGHVWPIERLTDRHCILDGDARRHFNLLALQMVVPFGAWDRTGDEYEQLLKAVGFEATTVLSTPT